jgi:hypothetical protein
VAFHLTDREVFELWRRHLLSAAPAPNPKGDVFVGTAYYAFARELEMRAMAAGLLLRLSDTPHGPESPQKAAPAGLGSRLWQGISRVAELIA